MRAIRATLSHHAVLREEKKIILCIVASFSSEQHAEPRLMHDLSFVIHLWRYPFEREVRHARLTRLAWRLLRSRCAWCSRSIKIVADSFQMISMDILYRLNDTCRGYQEIWLVRSLPTSPANLGARNTRLCCLYMYYLCGCKSKRSLANQPIIIEYSWRFQFAIRRFVFRSILIT